MRMLKQSGLAISVAAGLFACAAAMAQGVAPATGTAPNAPKPSAASGDVDSGFKLIVEPRAMALLKAVSDKLSAAQSMSFTAMVGYEYPSKLGPPIVYTMQYDVTMQRPDKLRILTPGDGPPSEFYYNGKEMVAYSPVENLAAVAPAPPTIEGALKAAYETASIFYPFTDLLVSDPYKAMTNGVVLAFYIGPSSVFGGVKTDMMAWANDDVFLHIWVGAEDKLPRRIRAVYKNDPLRLRHEMEITNWKLGADTSADAFSSAKAQAAPRMPFKSPVPPPKGAKPLTVQDSAKPVAPPPGATTAKTN